MTMEQKWIKVFSGNQSHLIHLLSGLLDEAGIASVIINKTDSMHVHLNDSASFMELYVQNDDVMRARRIIDNTEK